MPISKRVCTTCIAHVQGLGRQLLCTPKPPARGIGSQALRQPRRTRSRTHEARLQMCSCFPIAGLGFASARWGERAGSLVRGMVCFLGRSPEHMFTPSGTAPRGIHLYLALSFIIECILPRDMYPTFKIHSGYIRDTFKIQLIFSCEFKNDVRHPPDARPSRPR